MIRRFINRLEQECGMEVWRHYCKLRTAKTPKDFWDSLKALSLIVDKLLKRV